MPYVCGLDCNLVRNDSQISQKNPVSHIFMGQKKLTTEKKQHICVTFWTDAAVPENLILFCYLWKIYYYLQRTTVCVSFLSHAVSLKNHPNCTSPRMDTVHKNKVVAASN